MSHHPVLANEAIQYLACAPGQTVVDGTVGSGGHAKRIAEVICAGHDGMLIGVDRDPQQLLAAAETLAAWKSCVMLVHNSYDHVAEILGAAGKTHVDGVLLDLGVAIQHLEDPRRGMSFRYASAPLDLRFDPSAAIPTAADLLRDKSAQEIERWLREYGEVPSAKQLARTIVQYRGVSPLTTVGELEFLVVPLVRAHRRHNPMTLVLQALRIAVNDELAIIQRAIKVWVDVLNPNGRIVIISYHSLEDRIVKQTLRMLAKSCVCPPEAPICICGTSATVKLLTARSITPSTEELRQYPTSRSARLRAAEHV
ncbi:16S rRNA (cytosine(1402)-N(4))-methyltransferase RsmH [Candidatus Uhrbacteria bacterium]|nr:16S rRNA (cytosine(1402)-N(4))-methyltransferase RsmH [Candidatus Uhrbacteria bacterium]